MFGTCPRVAGWASPPACRRRYRGPLAGGGPAMAERQPDATRVPASVPRSDGVLVAVADLRVTHEELRVAEEELAEQREQIDELVAQHDSGQRWRDHLFALLPVGVLVTDGEGKVLEANARAAGLLGVRLVHLPGTPLLVYVQTAHRRLVRELLAQFGQGQRELRATVTVTPRQGQRFPADITTNPRWPRLAAAAR